MNNIKKAVNMFLNSYGIYSVSSKTLKEIIKRQGYSIVEYNSISNASKVDMLLDLLKVKPYALSCKAFTYADESNRIVFIAEGLSEAEELILLAHEEGHIFCGHLRSNVHTYGQDVIFEQEANEFAHYILKNSLFRSFCLSLRRNRVKYICACVAVAFICVLTVHITRTVPAFKPIDNEYVITEGGTKYHKPDCFYIKNSKEKITVTDKELAEFYPNREPCAVCLPK